MADYHAVLKRTLSAIPDPNEALRNKMYERARSTITAQLDATNPPLAPETKAAQVAKLEQAIVDLEAEYAPPAAVAPVEEPAADAAPEAPAAPEATAAPEASVAPTVDPAPVEPAPQPAVAAAPDPLSPEPPVATPDPLSEAFARIEAAREEAVLAEDAPVAAAEAAPAELAPAEGVPAEGGPAEPDMPPLPAVGEPVVGEPVVGEPVVGEPVLADAAPVVDAPPTDTPAGIDPATPDATIDDARFAAQPDEVGPEAAPDITTAQPVVAEPVVTAEPGVAAEEPETSDATAVDPAAFFNDPAINEREAAALAAAPGAATVSRPRGLGAFGGGGAAVLLVALFLLGGAVASAFLYRAPLLSAVGVAPDAVDTWLARVAPGLAPEDALQPKRVPTIRIRPPAERLSDADGSHTVPTRAAATPEPTDAAKLEQRLSSDGREVEPSPVREEVNTLPPPVAPVPLPADEAPADEAEAPTAGEAPADATVTEVETFTVPVRPVAPDAVPAAPPPPLQSQAQAETDTEIAAVEPQTALPDVRTSAAEAGGAQTARLIEEGRSERDLVRQNGTVTWSVVQESPGEGEPEEPAIQGVVRIPERDVTMTLTIRRNTDKALSASHLMTVLFSVPDDFRGANVEDIRGVVAKPNERAQGSPLSVLPAPVGQGMFFVALPNNERAVKLNLGLLRASRWLDMPVAYATGRRALLALEKGTAGEKVFDEVLDAWEKAES